MSILTDKELRETHHKVNALHKKVFKPGASSQDTSEYKALRNKVFAHQKARSDRGDYTENKPTIKAKVAAQIPSKKPTIKKATKKQIGEHQGKMIQEEQNFLRSYRKKTY